MILVVLIIIFSIKKFICISNEDDHIQCNFESDDESDEINIFVKK